MESTIRAPCAARSDDRGQQCFNTATKACSRCRLLGYCSQECQRKDWATHKSVCNSDISKPTWTPDWIKEGRRPSFLGASPTQVHGEFSTKYLWGNTCAIDILKIEDNEGLKMEAPLSLLFAASGDPRSVLKTMADLPSSFTRKVCITMNDIDFDIVARNAIIMLLMASDHALSAEAIIHVWYSGMLKAEHSQLIMESMNTEVRKALEHFEETPNSTSFTLEVPLGGGVLRLALAKAVWEHLFLTMRLPVRVSGNARTDITLGRKDHLHRALIEITDGYPRRHALLQFRERGIVLPYGADTSGFVTFNPTLYSEDGTWFLMDSADPLDGWSGADLREYARRSGGHNEALTNDLYGQLYHALGYMIGAAKEKMGKGQFDVTITCHDGAQLPRVLGGQKFDRIDTSNIADLPYLGLDGCLSLGRALLNPLNPHATLLTCFINAVPMATTQADKVAAMDKVLPLVLGRPGIYPVTAKYVIISAATSAVPVDESFNVYMELVDFKGSQKRARMRMKEKHSVIQPWPYRVEVRPGNDADAKAFMDLVASGQTGHERFVEWQLKRK